MPATSRKQAVTARIALAAKKGKARAKWASPSAKMARLMTKKQPCHFTHTKKGKRRGDRPRRLAHRYRPR